MSDPLVIALGTEKMIGLYDQAVRKLNAFCLAAKERHLAEWVHPAHSDHIHEIRRVTSNSTPPDVERYLCFLDGAELSMVLGTSIAGNQISVAISASATTTATRNA